MPGRDLVRTLEDLGMPPGDLQKWDRWLANVDSATTRFSGGNRLSISHLEADTGKFNISPPLSCAMARKLQQAIPNTAATAVEFASLQYNYGGIIDRSTWVGNNTKVPIAGSKTNRTFLATYYMAWDANATGYRRLDLYVYDKDDSLIISQPLSRIDACTVAGVKTVSSGGHLVKFGADDRYISFNAQQTSGGALDINVELGLVWVH